ncbi:hypothetical protein [Paenibacillus humicus]|uniref:hypothetical protein n=1 Tax=Paenibacillus humicus TaxID=412861 RepID=UPI000FD80205|nr:hypothetical protein [Paenibacillus humicus]
MTCASSAARSGGNDGIIRFTGCRRCSADAPQPGLAFSKSCPARHPAVSLSSSGAIRIKAGGIYLAGIAITGGSSILPALAVNGTPLTGALHGPNGKEARTAYQLVALQRSDLLELLDLSAPLNRLLRPSGDHAGPDDAAWTLTLRRLEDQEDAGFGAIGK